MKAWRDCSDAERIERWVNVERVLVALPEHEREKHFDMRRWGYENDCGTVGCAAGLCSLDDWFRDRGWSGIYVPIPAHEGEWVGAFFGPDRIFTNDTPRPVDTVIEEVRGRIAELRERYGVVA